MLWHKRSMENIRINNNKKDLDEQANEEAKLELQIKWAWTCAHLYIILYMWNIVLSRTWFSHAYNFFCSSLFFLYFLHSIIFCSARLYRLAVFAWRGKFLAVQNSTCFISTTRTFFSYRFAIMINAVEWSLVCHRMAETRPSQEKKIRKRTKK